MRIFKILNPKTIAVSVTVKMKPGACQEKRKEISRIIKGT